MDIKTCPKCQHENKTNRTICWFCGESLDGSEIKNKNLQMNRDDTKGNGPAKVAKNLKFDEIVRVHNNPRGQAFKEFFEYIRIND